MHTCTNYILLVCVNCIIQIKILKKSSVSSRSFSFEKCVYSNCITFSVTFLNSYFTR